MGYLVMATPNRFANAHGQVCTKALCLTEPERPRVSNTSRDRVTCIPIVALHCPRHPLSHFTFIPCRAADPQGHFLCIC